MKTLWWFKENAIAGMGRPGFNDIHWFELPFDEAALLGWLGQHSSGTVEFASFDEHLRIYVPKIFSLFKMDGEAGRRAIGSLITREGFLGVLGRLNERTGLLSRFEVRDDALHFEVRRERLAQETAQLKSLGIQRVVALTEHHHDREALAKDFQLHHLSIADLGPPTVEQVHALAEIVREAQRSGEKLAVHCLAGIGRTSTMLMAAHLHLGEKLEDLQALVARQNPRFVLTGPQAEFIERFAKR